MLLAGSFFTPADAAELSGRVLDVETGNPIRDVTVRLVDPGRAAASDREGRFEFRGLEPGQYRLLLSHVAYDRSDTFTVTIPADDLSDFTLNPSPWVLNDVVTTGTRSPHLLKNVPVQTEVISRRDFQRTGAKTVDEALVSSIGVQVTQGGLSGSEASIRGVEGDRVLVLINGERSVGRVRGSLDLSQYDLANVEKIEIVKGTGSTLYGSDAIGGVINIITKKPVPSDLKGNVYLDYGSHASYNPSAELQYGRGKTSFTLGGRYYATDGFDLDASTPHTNGQDQIKRLNLHGAATHKLSDKWSVTGAGRFMTEDRDWIESEVVAINALRDTTYVYDDEESNYRYDGSASFDYLSGDKYSMKFRIYGTYYDHQFYKYGDGFLIDTSETEDAFYELSYTSNYVIGAGHVATYGFDYNYQDLNSSELIDEKEADRSVAGYLQYEHTPVRSLAILPGVRYEHHSSFGDHVNPSLNVMYSPSEQLKLRGFVGRGFRVPSIKEQFFVFDHSAAGYIVYGGGVLGADMNPETSINSSISAEFSYGATGLHRLTYFYNHLDNLIEFVLLDFEQGYWRGRYVYENVDRAITQGIEWESRVRLSKAVDFSFSYNYLYSRDLSVGEKLINRPDHAVKFYLTGYYEKYGLGASFWGDYKSNKLWRARSNTGGNENEEDEFGKYAPHQTVMNINLFKRFPGGWESFVRMENLLDETNVEYGYWPGFQLFAGVKWSLQ